jgi:hypothetical protein
MLDPTLQLGTHIELAERGGAVGFGGTRVDLHAVNDRGGERCGTGRPLWRAKARSTGSWLSTRPRLVAELPRAGRGIPTGLLPAARTAWLSELARKRGTNGTHGEHRGEYAYRQPCT